MKDDRREATISELQVMMAAGRVSSRELVHGVMDDLLHLLHRRINERMYHRPERIPARTDAGDKAHDGIHYVQHASDEAR